MRVGDVIGDVFGSIRLIAFLFFAAIVLFGLFMTVGAAWIAPQAVDAAAERAERVGNRAIQAKLQAEREEALADDGWGYAEPSGREGGTYSDGEYVGGWGDGD